MNALILTALFAATPDASGPPWTCQYHDIARVLGVAPDGRFVTVEERRREDEVEGGHDFVDTRIQLRRKDGSLEAAMRLCENGCERSECWSNGEEKEPYCVPSPFERVAEGVWLSGDRQSWPIAPAAPSVFLPRLVASLGLTPLVPSDETVRADKSASGYRCRISEVATDGAVAVAALSAEVPCDGRVTVSAARHPSSPLTFVELAGWRDEGCLSEARLTWYERERLAARWRFPNALSLPDDTPAARRTKIETLHALLVAEPTHFEARVLLAELLRRADATASEAMALLSIPYPAGTEYDGEASIRYTSTLDHWKPDESFRRWLAAHVDAFLAVTR